MATDPTGCHDVCFLNHIQTMDAIIAYGEPATLFACERDRDANVARYRDARGSGRK
jgi:hypothetical protein